MHVQSAQFNYLPAEIVAKIIQEQDVSKPARYYSAARQVSRAWRRGSQIALINEINRARKTNYRLQRVATILLFERFGKELRCFDTSGASLSFPRIMKLCPQLHTFRHNIDEKDLVILVKNQPQLTALSFHMDDYVNHCPLLPLKLRKLCVTGSRPELCEHLSLHCPDLKKFKVRFAFKDKLPHYLPQQLKKFSYEGSKAYGILKLPAALQNLCLTLDQNHNFTGSAWENFPTTIKKLKLSVGSLSSDFQLAEHVAIFRLKVFHQREVIPAPILERISEFYYHPVETPAQITLPSRVRKLTLRTDYMLAEQPQFSENLCALTIRSSIHTITSLPSKLRKLDIISHILTTLPQLPNSLRWLSIQGANHFTLTTFPENIEELHIHNWGGLFFPQFPSYLQTLSLVRCNIEKLAGTSTLRYLKRLDITDCTNLISFSFPPSVRSVWLKNLPRLTKLEDRAPSSLYLLDIHTCPVENLPYFSDNMRSLTLQKTKIGAMAIADIPWHVNVHHPSGWVMLSHKTGIAKLIDSFVTG